MTNEKIPGRLHEAIIAAGVPISGVSIDDYANKATWIVKPATLQAAAQPIIDAFTLVEPLVKRAAKVGSYLGVLDSDPVSPLDGDLWITRDLFPTQTRALKFRDGEVTRALVSLIL